MNEIQTYQDSQEIMKVDPEKEIEFASRAAKALKGVVTQAKLSKKFNSNSEHLFFEAWQTVGQFYKATPKIEWVKEVRDIEGNIFGYDARAVVIQNSLEIGAAEASCYKDEANWIHKPLFQLKSMAQTRAQGKALRSCFSWVVVLAGYSATPAEEMDGIHDTAKSQPQRKSTTKTSEDNPFDDGSPALTVTDVTITTGKKKDGKEWTKYHVTTSDSKIWSTFSGTLGTRAQEAMKTGATVSVMGEEGQYGWDLKELSIATYETGTPTEVWTKEKIIDILTSSDNLDTLKANWASLIPHIGKLDAAGKGESQKAYDETERFLKEA